MNLELPGTQHQRTIDTRQPFVRVVSEYVAIHARHVLVPLVLLGVVVYLNVSIRPAMMEVSRLISAQMELIDNEGEGHATIAKRNGR